MRTDDQRRAALERGDGADDPAAGNGPADPLVQALALTLALSLTLGRTLTLVRTLPLVRTLTPSPHPLVQGDFRALWLALELARAPLPAHWAEDEVALPPPHGKGAGAARIFRRTAGGGEAPLTTLEHPLTPVFREVAVT